MIEALSEVHAVVEINPRSIRLLVSTLTAASADEEIYDSNRKMVGEFCSEIWRVVDSIKISF